MKIIPELYIHQKEAIEILSLWENISFHGIKGGILGFKMGLGKTRTMLELIKSHKSHKSHECTLIICNKSNIVVWENEIQKFYKNDFKYFILYPSTKILKDASEYDIIITTYEIVVSQFNEAKPTCFMNSQIDNGIYYTDQECTKKYDVVKNVAVTNQTLLYSTHWNRIITDESQKFANTKTKLYYSIVALKANSYFCLTGTPIVNYSTDLYALFKFMGLTLLSKKDWNIQNYNAFELSKRIHTKDYSQTEITLPDISNEVVLINLNMMETKIYEFLVDKLKSSYIAYYKGVDSYTTTLNIFVKLRQLCICPHLLKSNNIELFNESPELKNYITNIQNIKNSSKMLKFFDLLKSIIKRKEKVLVFTSFRSLVILISEILKEQNITHYTLHGQTPEKDRKNIANLFNTDDNKILLSTYKVGGMGLNLTGANNVILLEPWWNEATGEQAIFRSYRTGQDKNVKVYSLITNSSFEQHILDVQKLKYDMTKEFINDHKTIFHTANVDSKDIILNIVNQ